MIDNSITKDTPAVKANIEKAVNLFDQCSPFFLALGDQYRQHLLVQLALHPDGLTMADLAGKRRLSKPAISYHLKVLKDCGMVTTQKNGTIVTYYLNFDDVFSQIQELVSTVQNVKEAVGNKAVTGAE